MKPIISFIMFVMLMTLVNSCRTTKCQDGHKARFGKNPNHQYAVKGVEANLKALLDTVKNISGEASFKQNVMLVIQPLQSKHVVIRDALDNAYRIASDDPCNNEKYKTYNDLVSKALLEKEETEQVKEEIIKQIKSNGISGGSLEAIKQIVNDYNQKTSFK